MKEDILQKLLEYLNETQDFVLEQAPQVILQVIKYEKTSSLMTGALMLILLLVAGLIFFHAWKHPQFDSYGSRKTTSITRLLIPGMLAPVFFFSFVFRLID